MKRKYLSRFLSYQPWQLILFSVIGAVSITNMLTAIISLLVWGEVRFDLLLLGTVNAILVPILMVPVIIRALRRMVKLEETNQLYQEQIHNLELSQQLDIRLRRRADEMSFLYHLGISLASGKTLSDTLLALQSEIVGLMQVDAFYVAIYDAETDLVHYPIYIDDTGEGDPQDQFARSLSEDPGLTGAVIFGGATLYLPNMFDHEVIRVYNPVNERNLQLHSFVGVPLRSGGRVSGALSIQSKQINAYSDEQIQLIENIAVQAAVAIEKAKLLDQLHAELEERRRVETVLHESAIRLEIIHEIERALLSAQSLNEIAASALAGICKLIPCLRASISMFNMPGYEVTILAFSEENQIHSPNQEGLSFAEYGEYVLDGLRQNRLVFVDNVLDEPRATAWDKHLATKGIVAWMYIPLLSDGQLIGALNMARGAGNPFRQEDAESVIDIANELAIAIRQTHLLNALQIELEARKKIEASLRERESILEAVTFAAEHFLKTPDWRVNINQVMEYLGKTVDATHVFLFEHQVGLDGQEYSLLTYEWTAPGYPNDLENPYYQQPQPLSMSEDDIDLLLRQGNFFAGNISDFPYSSRERLQELGIKSILELPVFVDGKWWATFGIDDFNKEREWRSADVDALKVAVEILGAAVQRQKTEAAIHESERIYRQAIEAAGAVPYYRIHHEDRYAFMGNAIERIIGYKPEEITTNLWLDILKENIPLGESEGLSIDDAVQKSRMGATRIWHSDMRVIARNGEEKWITDSAVELFDDSDLSYASVGILQDVTDRKRTETMLRKRESILGSIAYTAEYFLRTRDWRENINLVLERLARELNATHGYLYERYVAENGETRSSLVYDWVASGHEADLDNEKFKDLAPKPMGFDRLYDILDSGEPLIGSASFFTSEESEYLKSINIKALLEMRVVVAGRHWGTIGFDDVVNEREWTPMEVDMIRVAANVLSAAIKRQLDETGLQNELAQRKKLIEELKIRNAESEILRESTAIVAATLEKAEAVDQILEQLARVVPYDSASVQLIQGNMLEIVKSRGTRLVAGEIGFKFEINDREPAYPVLQGIVPFVLYEDVQEEVPAFNEIPHRGIHAWMAIPLNVKGKCIGIIALDGRKKGQFTERDANLAVTYANQVAIALENARLFGELQAELLERKKLIGELENKNSELERFTYTVSHDLKSPLVTINGFLGYLEQDAVSGNLDRLKGDMQRIHDAVKKMQNLLNELLELSRIGRIMNPPEAVAFNTLTDEALYLVHGRLEERHVMVDVQPNLPVVIVDKPRIIEVLQNLLDNAAKYMGDQLHPHIEVGREGTEDGLPVFYVKDNGMGIAHEFYEQVFGLFNKLDPKSDGTGVGLALVKRIIEVHRGRIWIESEPGVGSTFFFTLPVFPG